LYLNVIFLKERNEKKNLLIYYFYIIQATAEIRLLKSLDYETSTQHEVVIEAEDAGQPKLKSTMKLTILVHDVNDNGPVFENSTYSAR